MKCPKCGTEGVEGSVCFYCKGVEERKREKKEKRKKKKEVHSHDEQSKEAEKDN